jgi:predicted O-methyltransferase YrrM
LDRVRGALARRNGEDDRRSAVELYDRLAAHGLVPALSGDLSKFDLFLRFAPPGHFYSPIADLHEIETDADRIFDYSMVEVPGIDLNLAVQEELFQSLSGFLVDWPFPEEPGKEFRYYSRGDNTNYGVGDAMMLHAMLRWTRPRRVIEVGSGFSSCMTLDTCERFLDGEVDLTFVEPYPELLYSLLKVEERDKVTVIESRLQDVPVATFDVLEAGDVLFIDSTHVVRIGSDVNDIFTRILPNLRPGVVVHFHDIFWPFEYPRSWVEEGRAWSELYVLRSFLQFNREFELLLFTDFLFKHRRPLIEARAPGMLGNSGGALWLRRVAPA